MIPSPHTNQIPSYKAYEMDEKSNPYGVCVFVLNEGEKFHHQLARMKSLSKTIDLIIADGGSTDGSTNVEILRSYGVNTLLVKTGNGQLGAQMRMAFAWALRRGYQGVVVIDGNNKDSVEDIPHFISKLEEGFDHIQGSRFLPGGKHENTPISRLIGLKILHVPCMRWASNFKHTDTTNGFRAYSARLLSDPRVAIFRDVFNGYELHYYLAIRAPKLGFKCTEIPVTRSYPAKGKTPTKISPIQGSIQIMHRLLCTIMGKYDPPK